jgi:hypothetical protein
MLIHIVALKIPEMLRREHASPPIIVCARHDADARIGQQIDLVGGRPVLSMSNLCWRQILTS